MKILENLNILLLEDDIEFATSFIETLELYFKTIYSATNIKDALETINTKKIDVAISDIHLEKENGLDFIETLKNDQNNIPIVILSGFKDEEFLFKAIKLGVIDYIVKPLDLEKLEEALSRCAESLDHVKSKIYKIKDNIYFDIDKKRLYEENIEIALTSREYLFLVLAIEHKGYILTKDMIEDAVYGLEIMSASALKNLLFRIRKKFGSTFITTIPELGYKINF